MIRQFWELFLSQIKETFRDPAFIFWAIFFPIVFTWGLGLAFSPQKENRYQMVSLSDDHKTVEKEFSDPSLGPSKFIIRHMNFNEGVVLLKRGEAGLIVDERNNLRVYHLDPMNKESELIRLKYEEFLGQNTQSPTMQIEKLKLKGTRYIDFLIPGMIALNVMNSFMWGISYPQVERRSKKLLRRMIATPMSKTLYFLSLFLFRIFIALFEFGLLFTFAHFYFGVEIQGSIPTFIFVYLAGVIAFFGIAVFVSYRVSSLEIAVGLINSVTMPMMILSGVFFASTNFPAWAQVVIKKLPLTVYIDSLRSVMIEAASFSQVALPMGAIALFGTLLFIIGIKIYKWY